MAIFDQIFTNYLGWLENDNCFAIKFEELEPAIKSCETLNTLPPLLIDIINWLDLDSKVYSPSELFNFVYGKGQTASSTKNKQRQFESKFTDEHYKLIDSPHTRNVLKKFGYEW